jgi:pyruvate dehydrogenase E2 component (dihydrolipoamide acetyltransferase)
MANVVNMPKLSDTMTVGTLVKWLKKEGDAVKSGDVVAEVETDKATMELDVLQSGVILKLFAKEGDQLAIGAPIYAVGKAGEAVPDVAAGSAPAAAAAPAKQEEPPAYEPKATAAAPAKASAPAPEPHADEIPEGITGRMKISPLAKRIAKERGVDLSTVKGTGPGGRIVRADVEKAALAPKPAPVPAAAATPAASGKDPAKAAPKTPSTPFIGTSTDPVQPERTVQVSSMRGTIARRLLESKTQIPHFYLELEIDAEPMVKLRAQINETFGDSLKVSLNDMILKACAHALRKVPAVNSSWEGSTIKQHAGAHISFAVAIDDGLITPVVRDCHSKTIFQISSEARSLAKAARERKLKPEQFTGGTFCVSNLGMMGIEKFYAIINPPNAAILAVGAVVKKPVVNAQDQIVVGQRLTLALSGDHRVCDGAVGAAFLSALKELLEKPLTLLA